MVKATASPIYQIKVTLIGLRPAIWRRLLVSSSISLRKLHDILQIAFGWTDSHLHAFEARGETYEIPDPEYPDTARNDARVRLEQVLLKAKDSMLYEYDFGDSWTHRIVLEKVLPPVSGSKAPRCIGGVRACPPEDCGGPAGYARLLEAMRDPFHPDHEEMAEWIGGDLNPIYFDQWEVNEELEGK
jgi:hypothetical protein